MILAVGSSSPPAFFFSQYIALATPAAKSLQSCPTLCDPIDVSPPGSPVSGILQARTLEWLLLALSISETFEYLESISCTCTCTHTHTAPVETLDWNFIEFVDLSLLFWDWVIFLLLIFQKGVWLFQPTLSLWVSFCSQCSSGFSPFHQECDIYHQKPTHHSHSFFFYKVGDGWFMLPFPFLILRMRIYFSSLWSHILFCRYFECLQTTNFGFLGLPPVHFSSPLCISFVMSLGR